MSRGQHYTLEGHLLRSRAGFLALSMDGGGMWQLDGPRKMLALVGQRVKVSGTRTGFDLIDVNGFAPV